VTLLFWRKTKLLLKWPTDLAFETSPKRVSAPSSTEVTMKNMHLESDNRPERDAGRQLVFDIGMNNGDDSAHYLAKGHAVVAVEANPELVEQARIRFRKEIAEGRILIESVGVAERAGIFPFWVNEERSVFSSFDQKRAARDGMRCHCVEVQTVTFDSLLEKYGVPYYVKLDVEGAERHCLECMQSFPRPEYVSVEAEALVYLQLLWQLGYRQFAIVDQMRHNSALPNFSNAAVLSRAAKHACSYVDRVKNRIGRVPFARGCSGPFAAELHAEWQSFEEVAYEWLHLHFGYQDRGTLSASSWYDFHARKSAVENCSEEGSHIKNGEAKYAEKLSLI
jgi:FkbM family methyltransferase